MSRRLYKWYLIPGIGLPHQQYYRACSVFVGSSTCLDVLHNYKVACRFEEAGYYLTTLKQFEHKPPDIIKERTDKDYHSILRTALTSISKVNKTDVETLRTSFGVSGIILNAIMDSNDERRAFQTFPRPTQTNCGTSRVLGKSKSRTLRMHSTNPSGIRRREHFPSLHLLRIRQNKTQLRNRSLRRGKGRKILLVHADLQGSLALYGTSNLIWTMALRISLLTLTWTSTSHLRYRKFLHFHGVCRIVILHREISILSLIII